MIAKIQFQIAMGIIGCLSYSYSQINDYFPLQIGRQQTYAYYRLSSFYVGCTPGGPPCDPAYDVTQDSGSVVYQILDSTTYQDTTTLWTVREIIHINTIEWHLNSSNVPDTTFSSWSQTQDDSLFESNSGNHKLFANMSILKLDGAEDRYSNQGSDSIDYFINDRYGTPLDNTFKMGIGITRMYYLFRIVGNRSWNYLKTEVILRSTVTSSKDNVATIPDYFLSQNYPNPFNPSTKITYSLPATEYVELEIFSSLGQSISKLIHSIQSVGNHSLTWDASGLPTGVYFYRLRTLRQTITRKMVLLK